MGQRRGGGGGGDGDGDGDGGAYWQYSIRNCGLFPVQPHGEAALVQHGVVELGHRGLGLSRVGVLDKPARKRKRKARERRRQQKLF